MSRLALLPTDRITVDVGRIPMRQQGALIVRQEQGNVVLFAGTKRVDMTTITAHRIGMAIAKRLRELADDELIVMKINGEPIELLPPIAHKVMGALLRKADAADDWQLQNRRRLS